MEDLEFDIFTDEQDDSIFTEDANQEQEIEQDKKEEITDVDPDSIFSEDAETEESQESVGSNEDNKNKGDSASTKKSSSSPNTYSSIAAALKEDGVLLNLEDEDLQEINGADDFAEAIEKEVTRRYDESQKRVKEALDYGVEPQEVRQFETAINYLNTLTEDTVSNEDTAGENLRKQLIYQDFLNKGFSETRAQKETDKSFSAGTDVEDALEALQSNKEHFTKQYQEVIKGAKSKAEDEKKVLKKQAEDLQKKIIDTEEPFEGIKLSKEQRQKIYDSIVKPVHKTADGKSLTALQKYESDNPIEFKQKLATIFALTDGFKKLDTLVKGKVQKQTRQSLRELEHALKNTPTYSDGRLKLANSIDDEDAYQGLRVDI